MDRFLGRKSELEALEREYERESGFVVIYGRRRVGKTRLINEFIKEKNALYLLASEEPEAENLKYFTNEFAKYSSQNYLADSKFTDWNQLFSAIAAYLPNKKKIIIIDEFQYLIKGNQAFASIFQRIWDMQLKGHNIMVILCGSMISMMIKHALSYESPLYGRRTAQIRLLPLRFNEIRKEYLKNMNFCDAVEFYAVTGGVPKYFEFFQNKKSLKVNIEDNILKKSGYLYEEPLFLLEKEINEPFTYMSIIKTIANGNHRLSQIAGMLEIKGNAITPYLTTLIDLGIVIKKVPITEKSVEKTRKGLYYINDNFIDFWFKFVYPYKSEIEMENLENAKNHLIVNFIKKHVSYVYEDICRGIFLSLCGAGKISFTPGKIGAYWDNNTEIDVVSFESNGEKVFVGECKYEKKKITQAVLNNLIAKVEKIAELNGKSICYGIFSKSGFDKNLLEFAKERNDIILINEDEIMM